MKEVYGGDWDGEKYKTIHLTLLRKSKNNGLDLEEWPRLW